MVRSGPEAVAVSSERTEVRTDSPAQLRRVQQGTRDWKGPLGMGFVAWSLMAWMALGFTGWIWVYHDGGRLGDVFSGAAWAGVSGFVQDLAGSGGANTPAFMKGAEWENALDLALETLQMSVLATAIAGIGALVTIPFAASNLTHGDLSRFGRVTGATVFGVTRLTYILTRAVPELVWALMIVFVLQAGVLAGAVALGIHNFGVLGRLGAEIVEDIDTRPVRALRSSGAGNVQIMFYGVLPQVLPQFITFLLYRWEVIIRTTAVVGFVAASGLGYQFRLDFAFFRYTDVALLLIVYIILVWMVDLASAGLRRLAQ
jgi:ABC-type phosphate/phosphonate transport system permease subunit